MRQRRLVHAWRVSRYGRRRTNLETWWTRDLEARFTGRIVPADLGVAERWSSIAAEAERKGIALPLIDGLIAATALQRILTIVSHNAPDFSATHASVLNLWEVCAGGVKASDRINCPTEVLP